MFLSAADILDAKDLEHVDEQVPEWGGEVRLRQLDASNTLEMTESMNASPKDGMFIILVYTAVDPETDQHLFPLSGSDVEKREQLAAHVLGLRRKSFRVLSRLQKAAMTVNKMGPQARAEAKNVLGETAIVVSPTV